ncbi:hypothetical protein M413DRAFT_69552 [Hebeloma cylindrosporum]|uniref:SHSP domain-containing protein n=1 Tax=Hebeloma cylindrosporum TaxID=76867 RepID=A0A0C3CGP6_HEBCY|nr:hypothetical protein M413DRAFT_69552 [Hebeloma cylindrosporum h7]
MSLARQFLREMRPFFHMLEEPFGRSPTYLPALNRMDPFQEMMSRPAIDVSDKGDRYVVDADLPGVPKENVEVRIGDNGRSITIEGKVIEQADQGSKATSSEGVPPAAEDATTITKLDESATQISTERPFTRNVSFTRTVWLPRPVDTSNVSAKLENGVLSITVNKAEDKASTVIPVN